jgi:sugar phosphate isomerase/epimerase
MRLTVSQYTFEAIPFEGTLAICQSMGFKGVVVAAFADRGKDGLNPHEIAANPQKHADHLNALLDKYELELVDFFPQLALSFRDRAINHPNSDIRKQNMDAFRGLLRFCKLTRAPGITVLPGAYFFDSTLEENLDLSGESLRQIVAMAHDDGIHVYFEPHMESVCDKPELTLALVERAPGVKLALDYSHYVVQYIPLERIHPLLPHAGTVHVRQARGGKIQSRYNEGIIDFVDMIQRLKALGYQDCLTIEYVCADWYGANELDTLAETMVTKAVLEQYVSV